MPEEQNRAGDTATRRLVTLLDALGWSQRGDLGVDIPCELASHRDRESPHGVDAYMVYDDPFRTKERGVVIESKTKGWTNTNPSSLSSGAEQTLETLECIPESDGFDELLNFGAARNIDAGILGVWVNDGNFEAERFDGYVSELEIELKRRKPFQILVLGNQDLNRLASLHSEFVNLQEEFRGEDESVDFYYPSLPDSVSERRKLISIENMLSDYIFAKGRKFVRSHGGGTEPKSVNIVFYFDDIDIDSLKFMFKALLKYQMTDTDEIRVYLDDRSTEEDFQLESVREGFLQWIEETSPNSPTVELTTLPQVSYDTYTDNLRGA